MARTHRSTRPAHPTIHLLPARRPDTAGLSDRELFAYYKAHDVWFSIERLLRPDNPLPEVIRQACFDLAESIQRARKETVSHRRELAEIRSMWRRWMAHTQPWPVVGCAAFMPETPDVNTFDRELETDNAVWALQHGQPQAQAVAS